MLLVLCVSGIGWAQAQQAVERPKSITVVTDDNYPPFIFRDSTGEVQGILKDTWALWEKHTGIRVDLQAMDWGKAQAKMAAGQADVIDTVFKTEARQAVYDFSEPYAKLDVPIFFHESISGTVNVDSLKDFTVGVKDGDACIDFLLAKSVDNIKKYASYLDVIKAAGAGEVRVFCVDQPPAVYLLNQLGLTDKFRQSQPLYSGEFHRAVHKGNAALLQIVEAGFGKITAAEHKVVDERWYGAQIGGSGHPRFSDYARAAAYVLLGVLFLAGGLILWSLSLRRRVARKTAELSLTIDALDDAKAASERSLRRLNATLAAIPDLMFEVGLDGMYYDFHSSNDSLLVLPGSKLLGKTLAEVMPEEAAGIVLSALREAHETGRSHGRQIKLKVPEGFRWFELSVANRPVGPWQEPRFIVLSRDVTDRKRSEEALANKTALLRETFDHMREGISIMDGDQRLVGWNRRFAELLDFPESLLNDKATYSDIVRFNALRGEYGPGEPEALVLEREMLAAKAEPHHFERVRPDGRVIEVRGVPIPGGGMVSTYVDITERKQAESARALLESQLRESQKMQAIGTLAGGIAHDFNNIIAAILGNTVLARQDSVGNAEALESLEEIHKSATRARSLVQQILSFSRRQPTARKPICIVTVVEESVRLLRATLPGRIVVEFCIDGAIEPVLADETQVQQVVINLVNNAAQAMRSASGRIDIRLDMVTLDTALVESCPALQSLHAAHPGPTVRLSVEDKGPGMDAATLGRIFEPFFSTKQVDEGTGLGLSVVHGIVQTHEGAISVESLPGQGATFTVYLPVAQETSDCNFMVGS